MEMFSFHMIIFSPCGKVLSMWQSSVLSMKRGTAQKTEHKLASSDWSAAQPEIYTKICLLETMN